MRRKECITGVELFSITKLSVLQKKTKKLHISEDDSSFVSF